ncbi:MAG: hypothetical protein MHPSP_004373, partial [Paramarteilia canceri]
SKIKVPIYLVISETEASIVIQKNVRKKIAENLPEIKELKQWQSKFISNKTQNLN